MQNIYYDENCVVIHAVTRREAPAVIMKFDHEKQMTVVFNKSVKVTMKWNGLRYEGRSAGMDFESAGPNVVKSITGTRG